MEGLSLKPLNSASKLDLQSVSLQSPIMWSYHLTICSDHNILTPYHNIIWLCHPVTCSCRHIIWSSARIPARINQHISSACTTSKHHAFTTSNHQQLSSPGCATSTFHQHVSLVSTAAGFLLPLSRPGQDASQSPSPSPTPVLAQRSSPVRSRPSVGPSVRPCHNITWTYHHIKWSSHRIL